MAGGYNRRVRTPTILDRLSGTIALALVAWLIARTAWISDDAFITLRTLENALSGHGLRYNIAERVQAYTHPLWLALLALPYAATREPWMTTMAVGAATSLAAVGALWRQADSGRVLLAAVLLLAASKAWVDYTTSGLENPLLWLLLAGFAAELFREPHPRGPALVLLASAIGLTRLDALLIVVPALGVAGHAAWRRGDRQAVLTAQVGWLPLLAWHAATLIYYGALFPNTAWAKLGTGLSTIDLAAQSLHYFGWTLAHDPATLVALAAGLVLGGARREPRAVALAIGALLYLLYVVRIGGDFMAGRFFTAPLWVAVLLVLRRPMGRALPAISAVVVVLSLLSPHSPLRAGPSYARADSAYGVVDERGYFWSGTGWWTGRTRRRPTHPFARAGAKAGDRTVVVKSVVGLYAYYAGPKIFVVDRLGLTDPLTSRMPREPGAHWRIGHVRRTLPDGYTDSVARGANLLPPGPAHELYDAVRLATRGPLWTWSRWRAIVALHMGSLTVP